MAVRAQNKQHYENHIGGEWMMFALKLFGAVVGIYASVNLSKIAIEWMKKGFDRLRPRDRYRDD